MAQPVPSGAPAVSPEWALEQRFPKPDDKYADPTTLHQLQRYPSQGTKCNVSCGGHTLRTTDDSFAIWFWPDPDPLQSKFVLQLRLVCPPKAQIKEELSRYATARLTVNFATFDATRQSRPDRVAHKYTGKRGDLPDGPLHFSDQLFDVQFSTLAERKKENEHLEFSDKPPTDQLCFTWRSKDPICWGFSNNPTDLPDDAIRAIETFKNIIATACEKDTPIHVVTRPMGKIPSYIWPWFAALPSPTLPSYFPWMKGANVDPQDLMEFRPNHAFELLTPYLDRLFAIRKKGWYQIEKDKKSVVAESANVVPDPLQIGQLPAVTQFMDERQYLTYVLGSHAYEENASNRLKYVFTNGEHMCDVFPDENGSSMHVLLLNIRPPTHEISDPAAAAQNTVSIPEIGERVQIVIILDINIGEEEWHGKVIRIPGQYKKLGWNVAIEAVRPPTPSGRVLAHRRLLVYFYFGHSGTPAGPLRATIINNMINPENDWWKRVLLAHDNYQIPRLAFEGGNPLGWRQCFETHVYDNRSLNLEQRDAINHFFSNRLTIVVGPPGTGKSTLVDTILELHEKLQVKPRFWVCTDSNAAVDVLAKKFTDRKGTGQPSRYYRIKPLFDEHLTETNTQGDPVDMLGLPTLPGAALSASSVIAQHIAERTEPSRLMALGDTLRERMDLLKKGRLHPKFWRAEDTDLAELTSAREAVSAIRLDMSAGATIESVNEEMTVRKKYLKKLRELQKKYVSGASGVFSTTAAASSRLMEHFEPQWLIMDESSQFSEAKAVHAILHAFEKNVERVLLIGDHNQLPPTLLAPRNPFHKTAARSLMERLILAGTPTVQLRTQFRSHPTISAIYNETIYDGSLRDGQITTTRPDVAKFQTFIGTFANASGHKTFPGNTSSVVVSPVKPKDPTMHWGSEKKPGSTSRINMLTAKMVYLMALRVIDQGKFRAEDILVTAFYSDQVELLTALFQDDVKFSGIRIMTVDGSQGNEAPVQIIDCVVFGAGAPGDTMGFLSSERRRFNVGMSRGMVGRIVIAHQDMTNMKTADQKGVWPRLLAQAKQNRWIIPGSMLAESWPPDGKYQSRYQDVRTSFESATRSGLTKEVETQEWKNGQVVSRMRPSKTEYDIFAFMEATITSEEVALRYLKAAKGQPHVAIHRYFTEHPKQDDSEGVEEIVRDISSI